MSSENVTVQRDKIIEAYELKLQGKIKRLPYNIITRESFLVLVKYIIQEKLKWTHEEVCKNFSFKFLKRYGLEGAYKNHYSRNIYELINDIYPSEYKAWEIGQVPRGFWTEQTGIEATRWLIEEKMRWNHEEISRNISNDVFLKNGLSGMMQQLFNNRPIRAINAAYPGEYKEWEFKRVSDSYWNEDTAIEATRWLIDKKLKWRDKEILEELSQKIFIDYGLYGMLSTIYQGSPVKAICAAYPGRYKVWEFTKVPRGYWTEETAIEATKWLFEKVLKWNNNQTKERIGVYTFRTHGLTGMIQVVYGGSPFKAIDAAYPGKFKPWECSIVPNNYWTKKTAIEATKWLIEEKLCWDHDEVCKYICYEVFESYNLGGMLQKIYKSNVFRSIDSAYPGEYKREELKEYK